MIRYYKAADSDFEEVSEGGAAKWIRMTDPTHEEAALIGNRCGVDPEEILAAVDPNEHDRAEQRLGGHYVVVDVPFSDERHGRDHYKTVTLVVITTPESIITSCSEECGDLAEHVKKRLALEEAESGFGEATAGIAVIPTLILEITKKFQSCLREVDGRRRAIDTKIGGKTDENDIIELHELESTLVYFETALSGNGRVIDKLSTDEHFRELLTDASIENRQALAMCDIYESVIDSTRSLVSDLLDTKLNNVMKILTSITIVLAIPTVISGMYGMNVNGRGMPLSAAASGFALICLGTLAICLLAIWILKKKHML